MGIRYGVTQRVENKDRVSEWIQRGAPTGRLRLIGDLRRIRQVEGF
jgi:hypothetical protein